METRSVKAIKRLDGRITSQILVYIHGEDKLHAYDIQRETDSEGARSYFYMVDGKRHDFKPHEVLTMRKAIREVRDDK